MRIQPKIVSEHGQEIPQLQNADKPMAPRGRATQQSRDTMKANQAKQSALFSLLHIFHIVEPHCITNSLRINIYSGLRI